MPDERADLLPDLHAGEPLGREPGFERAINLLDIEVDHLRLRLRNREARLNRVDAQLLRGSVDGRFGPPVKHGILSNRERETPAELLERTRVGHAAQLGCSTIVRKPRSGRRTRISAAAIAAAPIQSSGRSTSP